MKNLSERIPDVKVTTAETISLSVVAIDPGAGEQDPFLTDPLFFETIIGKIANNGIKKGGVRQKGILLCNSWN